MDELGLASYPEDLRRDRAAHPRADPARAPFPEVRRFAKALAEEVERRIGDQAVATTTWRVADRVGRVRRLRPERPRPHDRVRLLGAPVADARVSAPLRWDEVPTSTRPRSRSRRCARGSRRPATRCAACGAAPSRSGRASRALGLEPPATSEPERGHLRSRLRARLGTVGRCAAGAALAAVAAVAAVLLAPWPRRAAASPYVRYGVQDDAWLRYGPGTLEQRLDRLDSLGVELVRVNVPGARSSRGAASSTGAATTRSIDGLHARGIEPVLTLVGDARPGRTAAAADELGADVSGATLRRLRAPRRRALPVRQALADLERAEPAPLAAADRRRRSTSTRLLNPAYAAIHRVNPSALVAGGVTAPRGGDRRRLARRVDRRHGGGARAPRRVRAQPVPAHPAPRRRSPAAATTATRSRWRRSTGC